MEERYACAHVPFPKYECFCLGADLFGACVGGVICVCVCSVDAEDVLVGAGLETDSVL